MGREIEVMNEQTKFPVGTHVRTPYGTGWIITAEMYREAWSIKAGVARPGNIVAYAIYDDSQIDCADETSFEKWEKAPEHEEGTPPGDTETRIRQIVKENPNAAINALLEMVIELFSVQAKVTELLYPLVRNHAHVIEEDDCERLDRKRNLNELAVFCALRAEAGD